ncbi:MAG: amino acid permease [Acidobacteria bacterium]|nr:amino acid permease [Acidobacteriota bacterium]
MELKRRFGLWTAVAVIIGQVIGVGIFLVPAGMAKSVGSPAWLFSIWAAVGLMTLCGALCYAELASRFPEAGGSYVYLREAYGKGAAFVYGWMVLLVLDPGLTAIFGVGFASYASFIFELSPAGQTALAIAAVLAIGTLTMLGTGIGAGFLRVLTLIKVGTLLFIVAFGFLSGSGNWANLMPFFSTPPDIFGALAGGLVGAFFAFAGWWEVTRMTGEIADPERNVPRTLVLGILGLSVIYILTSAVFMYLVPAASVANDEAFAALAGQAMFGPVGGQVFAAVVCISVVGTLFAYLLVSPRVYYAMANDGLFFRKVGELHPRFGTPYLAIAIQMVLASVLILTGGFNEILGYFFFVVILAIGVAVAGLHRIRRAETSGYRTPLYPLPLVVYLILTAVVLFFVGMRSPLQTATGLVVVSLGIPVYHFIFKRKHGLDKNH